MMDQEAAQGKPGGEHVPKLLAEPADFKPNLTSTHEVLLPYSLEATFQQLGQGSTFEASVRLSDLCHSFSLLQTDTINLPEGQSLDDITCRNLPPSSDSQPGTHRLERQFFILQEAVPILPANLYNHIVTIAGSFTTDRQHSMALYESSATGGVRIWKLRVFTEQDGQTKVHEVIKGRASPLLRSIVEKETRRAHRSV